MSRKSITIESIVWNLIILIFRIWKWQTKHFVVCVHMLVVSQNHFPVVIMFTQNKDFWCFVLHFLSSHVLSSIERHTWIQFAITMKKKSFTRLVEHIMGCCRQNLISKQIKCKRLVLTMKEGIICNYNAVIELL